MTPTTKPVPDLTTRQAAVALFGDDGKAEIRHVQRLINAGQLEAVKLPGPNGPFLVKPASIRDLQQKFAQKKRRQADKKST
jgi:hypothetical protein